MSAADVPPGGAVPAKADPETLALRAAPMRVTRFRRGAIVGIAAAGSVAIAGVAWLALKPAGLGLVVAADDTQTGAKVPPDALAGAPASYGDVPKLGPPLPGDLGRPILNHRRGIADNADAADSLANADRRAAQDAEAERQRRAAAVLAARESGVMMPLAGQSLAAPPPAIVREDIAVAQPAAAAAERDPGGQLRKNDLVGRTNRDDEVSPHRLMPAVSPHVLSAGSVIAASLITGLDSDLPGLVTAQVTENAYDSVTGRTMLIPQGSRLIGRYDSVVAFGQSRALVVWQRIILPDGSSIRIDNVPATDRQGYAGLSDRIDRHGWQLLRGVALSTLLGVGTEIGFGSGETDLVGAIREAAQQNGARAGDQIVGRSLDIQSTLRVRPGWPLRVVVHKDILLAPWQGGKKVDG
ncbi:TrbI/VirB10 family protein [Sphingopyxis sp. DBS4]|uniref:TrbI/VirB10 family protein n=1 Tax=Sphingopyxis sp. DBS4 TaxID=2968500 RepID=UPI00214BC49D|nr:TrbI/VirB10 family protein [Sphingopyxis sp. DBS4]